MGKDKSEARSKQIDTTDEMGIDDTEGYLTGSREIRGRNKDGVDRGRVRALGAVCVWRGESLGLKHHTLKVEPRGKAKRHDNNLAIEMGRETSSSVCLIALLTLDAINATRDSSSLTLGQNTWATRGCCTAYPLGHTRVTVRAMRPGVGRGPPW